MFLSLIFLTVVVSAWTTKTADSQLQPFDLEDEVREQLENLRSIVKGEISAALSSLDNKMRQMYSYRNSVMLSATSSVRSQYQTFTSEVTTLKDLAQAAGQNVDVCLASNEPLLNTLYDGMVDVLWECLWFADGETANIQRETQYRIDVTINEVNIFDFQLDLCAGDFMCMSPLTAEIELAAVKIPQKIALELQEAERLCEELKVLIQDCMDSKVAHFIAEGSAIVGVISSCINNMLS